MTTAKSEDARPPLPAWKQWLPSASTIAAGFTTLCCLGLPALIAFLSSIGATFLTRDATLQPLLAVLLLFTIAASGLTWRGHRNPTPFIATVVAAALIYPPLYGLPLLGEHDSVSGHGDHRGGPLVWLGLVLLFAAQAFDLWHTRTLRHRAAKHASLMTTGSSRGRY